MKLHCFAKTLQRSLLLASLTATLTTWGATSIWTNSAGGRWSDSTNWLDALAPNNTSPVFITNSGTKTITIDATTPAENLAAERIILRGTTGFTNTLRVMDLTNQALQIMSFFTNGQGGAMVISNASVEATAATRFSIDAGTVTLESGLLDCTTVPVRIGRGGTGGLLINSGTVLADELFVGEATGARGELALNGGNLALTFALTVGSQLNSTGMILVANAQLAGGDSAVTNKIGNSGVGELAVNGGGSVSLPSLSVGDGASGKGTITLNGGQVTITDTITKLGNSGLGQLILNSGSVNLSTSLILGDNPGATGLVWVIGGQLTSSGNNLETVVGEAGVGHMNIQGGTVRLLSTFIVADNPGSTGTVNVTGGALFVTNGICSIGRASLGTMTISNALVMLTNVSVGRQAGSTGTLELQTDADLVLFDDLSIGRFTNALGYVRVNGGHLSMEDDTIWVGREGTGHLIVSNGVIDAESIWVALSTVTSDPISGLPVTNSPAGTVTIAGGTTVVSSNMLVGTAPFSTGQVSMVSGNLVVTNAAKSGYLNIGSGSFALTGGNLAADNIFVTNASGQFLLQAGTLQLLGGTYAFANGLVISSNATLAGCGTVLGNVVNYGSIIANCQTLLFHGALTNFGSIIKTNGASLLARPIILSLLKEPSARTITCSSLGGLSYTLEYKNSLGDPSWVGIPPAIPGNGSSLTLIDSSPAPASRLYRVRAQ